MKRGHLVCTVPDAVSSSWMMVVVTVTRDVYPMEDLRPTMVNTAQLPYDLT